MRTHDSATAYKKFTRTLIGRANLSAEDEAHRQIMFLLDGPEAGMSQADKRWSAAILALMSFAAREGHTSVPAKHLEGDFPLGAFVSRRRMERNSGRLDLDKAAELEALPGWTWAATDYTHQQGIAALGGFAAREGHTRVPGEHMEGDFALGAFVTYRRTDWKAGKLSPEKTAELATFPGWEWDHLDYIHQQGIAALGVFAAREGHARVPRRHKEGDFPLGVFVGGRRADHKSGSLSPQKAAELATFPGWEWDAADYNYRWGLTALTSFAEREGHSKVPQRHKEGDFPLGTFVSRRRAEHKAGRLDPRMAIKMESLSDWVWSAN